MLKQLSSRNQRTKGFKVKHSFQILLLIAVGIWLLYQLKHSIDKKEEYEQSSVKALEKLQSGGLKTAKLGRKGFQPWIKKPKDLIEDEEDSKPEKMKVRRGERDDESNGHDQDKLEEEESEEVEDLIDEEDKEREEESEEEEAEDMGKQTEDMNSLKDQSHDEGEKDAKESEKHYKENGASRVMMRQTQSIASEFEFGGLESSEKTETVKQQNKIMPLSQVAKVGDNVTIEQSSFQNGVLDFSDSKGGSYSDSLLKMEKIEPRAYNNLTWTLLEVTGSNENVKASDGGIGKEDDLQRAHHQ